MTSLVRSLDGQSGDLSLLQRMLAALGFLPARNPLVYSDAIPAANNAGYTASAAAETTFAPAMTMPTFAANTLKAGQVISVYARGAMTTAAVLPTLTLKVKLGSTTIFTFALNPVVSLVNGGWDIDCHIGIQAIGANGTIEADAKGTFAIGLTSASVLFLGKATGTVLNTSVDLPLSISATWGATGSSIQLHRSRVYLEN